MSSSVLPRVQVEVQSLTNPTKCSSSVSREQKFTCSQVPEQMVFTALLQSVRTKRYCGTSWEFRRKYTKYRSCFFHVPQYHLRKHTATRRNKKQDHRGLGGNWEDTVEGAAPVFVLLCTPCPYLSGYHQKLDTHLRCPSV